MTKVKWAKGKYFPGTDLVEKSQGAMEVIMRLNEVRCKGVKELKVRD